MYYTQIMISIENKTKLEKMRDDNKLNSFNECINELFDLWDSIP